MIHVTTPPRILIKRALFRTLQNYLQQVPSEYQFELMQDYVGEFNAQEWQEKRRLVIVYLDEVANDGSYTSGTETASFSILCAVSPGNNDDTTGAEGLHLLAEQVRCALFGHGDTIGLQHEIPKSIQLTAYSSFNFKVDAENSFRKENLVLFGLVSMSISYIAHEYEDYQFKEGQGIIYQEGEENGFDE